MACLAARPTSRPSLLSRASRSRVHRQLKVTASFQNPHAALGVTITADIDQIKKAYRKLALQWHPDVSKKEGSETVFLQLTEAYEFLVGKLRGNDTTESSSTDWDFHDWYWNFRINRTWKQQQAGSAQPSEPRPTAAPKTNIREQLAGLRQRAAIRATKARNAQSSDSSRSSIDDEACELELEGEPYRYSGAAEMHSAAAQTASQAVLQDADAASPATSSSEDFSPRHDVLDCSNQQHVEQADNQNDDQPRPSNPHGPPPRRKFVAHTDTRDNIRHQLAGLRRKAMIMPKPAAAATAEQQL